MLTVLLPDRRTVLRCVLMQVIALEVQPHSGVALIWDPDLNHPQLPFPSSLQHQLMCDMC
jgi:hypothetical protein